ncbi:DUF998 domain-containing protein, partial [Vulcaniibacterium tengchongense]
PAADPAPAGRGGAWPRRLGHAALLGTLAFALGVLALHALRPELPWRLAPLSFYLAGPYGAWLKAAYCALALALAALGLGCYAVSTPQRRSAAPAVLFVAGAAALVTTALAHTYLPGQPPTIEQFVHSVSAQAAFLCTTVAMLLQAWRFRADPVWRGRFVPAFVLAALCFVAMWVHALWRELPRGLGQKAVVAAIWLWLALAALWLRRAGRQRDAAAAPEREPR